MYSVVFGELFGFIMLAVTVAGALALFGLLSGERSGVLLVAVYMFFSSAENEYTYADTPIINTAVQTLRMGAAGMGEAMGRKTVILLVSMLAGGIVSLSGTSLPAALGAISCCALLYNGVRNIYSDLPCLIGAAAACILAYF